MRTLAVVVASLVGGLLLGGCGAHPEAAPSRSVAPSAGVAPPSGSGVPPSSGSVVPPADAGSGGPSTGAGGATPSPGGLPGIGITGPTPCLTSQLHFDTDADRSTPQVCLRVGAAFDLATTRPERSLVTEVISSDPSVLTCGAPRPTVCQAKKTGQSVVTATDGAGRWRVAVFVGP